MLAPTMSLGLMLALGLIVLSSVDAGSGIKTMQVSVLPNDQISIRLVPGAPRAVLSIASHVGDGAPHQSALVNNIWGAHDGKLCFVSLLAGDSIAAEQGTQVIGSIPVPKAKSNDTLLDLHGWMPPTISSSLSKKFLVMDRECMDIHWRWESPQKEHTVEFVFSTVDESVSFLRLMGGSVAKAYGLFSAFPGMVTIASGEPGVNIKSVTVHRANGGVPPAPNKDRLPLTVARHTMMMATHGSNIKIPFEPQLSNATLTFSVHNAQAPQQAVIYNIVGHKDGKFCVVSMWSMPTNRDVVDYSKVTHAPWDIAFSKPLKRFRNIPKEVRSVIGCPGWYGTTKVSAFLDTCKDAKGAVKWDRVPQQVEMVFKSEPNGWRLLLNNQVMPGEFVDGWLPAAAGKNYNFCVGPSPGMVVKSVSVGND